MTWTLEWNAAARTLASLNSDIIIAKWYNVIDDKDSVIFPRALIEIIELWSLTFACPL